jgi:hypothetical protein
MIVNHRILVLSQNVENGLDVIYPQNHLVSFEGRGGCKITLKPVEALLIRWGKSRKTM